MRVHRPEYETWQAASVSLAGVVAGGAIAGWLVAYSMSPGHDPIVESVAVQYAAFLAAIFAGGLAFAAYRWVAKKRVIGDLRNSR